MVNEVLPKVSRYVNGFNQSFAYQPVNQQVIHKGSQKVKGDSQGP